MYSELSASVKCHRSPFVLALLANLELHPGFGFGRWSFPTAPHPCPKPRWRDSQAGTQGRGSGKAVGGTQELSNEETPTWSVSGVHTALWAAGLALCGHPGHASTFHESQPQRQRDAVRVPLTISKSCRTWLVAWQMSGMPTLGKWGQKPSTTRRRRLWFWKDTKSSFNLPILRKERLPWS